MTSYIGLHVSLTLTDSPSPLTGHIKAIDGQRNVLVLRPSSSFSSQDVTIDRSRIKAITIVEAQKEQQPAKTSSNNTAPASSSSSAAPFGDGLHSAAPDAGRLPTPNPPKSAKKKARAKKANPQASAVPSSSSNGRSSTGIPFQASTSSSSPATVPQDDFDFEASARGFDKAKIWSEIRAQDQSDPSALLVSHNRAKAAAAVAAAGESGGEGGGSQGSYTPLPGSPRVGTGLSRQDKMRKLRNDENVLSPSPPESPELKPVAVPKGPEVAAKTSSAATTSGDSDLQRQLAILQRRAHLLESLSGLSLEPTTEGSDCSTLDFTCTLSPLAIPASGSPPLPATQTLSFNLQTSLDAQDPKIRYTPGADVPQKYNRAMGLRLDNGSAKIFVERLRGSIGTS